MCSPSALLLVLISWWFSYLRRGRTRHIAMSSARHPSNAAAVDTPPDAVRGNGPTRTDHEPAPVTETETDTTSTDLEPETATETDTTSTDLEPETATESGGAPADHD